MSKWRHCPTGTSFVQMRRADLSGPLLYVCWNGTMSPDTADAAFFGNDEALRMVTILSQTGLFVNVRCSATIGVHYLDK